MYLQHVKHLHTLANWELSIQHFGSIQLPSSGNNDKQCYDSSTYVPVGMYVLYCTCDFISAMYVCHLVLHADVEHGTFCG